MNKIKILLPVFWLAVCATAIAYDPFRNTLAYQKAALPLMVAEAEVYIRQLGLQEPLPIAHFTERFVATPGVKEKGIGAGEIGGGLGTSNFFFGFDSTSGKLFFVHRFHPLMKGGDPAEISGRLAKMPSLIDTRQAYQMATQWLAAISVDVKALQAKYPVEATQQRCLIGPPDRSEGLGNDPPIERTEKDYQDIPIFNIKWSDKVSVRILGVTRELLDLRLDDISFSKRPPLLVPNTEALLSIPDPTNNVTFKPARPKPATPPAQNAPPL